MVATILADPDKGLASRFKAFPGVVQEWWRPILTSVLLCLGILLVSPTDSIDRRLSDRLLVGAGLPADSSILIVQLDSGDMRQFGGPPINRDGLAKLLNHLADHRVKRVLVDSTLREPLFADSDRRLAQAMARLGPQRLGLVSSATPEELPYAQFAQHATIVDSRLTPDIDGWHRSIGLKDTRRGNNPATWLATGRSDPGPVKLDIRISPFNFETRSARAMIASAPDLSDKTVLISYSPLIAPSRAMLPMTINANRGHVIAVGAQSVKQGYAQLRSKGDRAGLAIQFAAVLIALMCGLAARSGKSLLAMMAASSAILFAACISLGQQFATEVFPVQMLTCFVVMTNVTLAQRLKLVPMITSFLRGDLSPEDVWAWRGHEQSASPAILLSFDGRIKRFNLAAAHLVEVHGEQLARACLPRPGEPTAYIELGKPETDHRILLVEWPHKHLSIAVLRDITHAESAQRSLEQQLLTDELTGQANRRGFERALHAAAFGGSTYVVFYLDMNGFKSVNDTFGHDAGDELLVQTGERLAKQVPAGDLVARLGGDEFAVIASGTLSKEQADQLARQFAETISRPFHLSSVDREISVGVAVGFARSEEFGQDPAELLRSADQAMYRNKQTTKRRLAA